jgi:hypothetical protein
LVLNSDSSGQLSLDGGEAVALVIAPGPALVAQAGTGCTAWTQSRPAAGPPDLRNYLECENATSPADTSFVAGRPGQTFNDQVLRLSSADVMPALEAAIAERMQREIAPALRAAYTSSLYSGIPAGSPLFPYAAPFWNPGTSDYEGVDGVYQGLLPFNTSSSMVYFTFSPGDAVETAGYGSIQSQSCWWEVAGDLFRCEGEYRESSTEPWRPIVLQQTGRLNFFAMGLRRIDTSNLRAYARDNGTSTWTQVPTSHVATVFSDGTVRVRFWATMPNIDAMGWGSWAEFRIEIDRASVGDHFLLNADPSAVTNPDGAATSWFVRNEWHRFVYYAVTQPNTAIALSSFDCTSSNCLRLNDPGTRNIRALLVLAGRALPGQVRPSNNIANYLENQNADGGTLFEQRPVRRVTMAANANAPWNDRIVIVDWNSPLQEPAQVIDDNIPAVPVRVASLP